MTLLRAFIAIEIPPSIRQAIHTQTAALRGTLGPALIRWVPTENLHLTLKFLGEISPANVNLLAQALTAEAAACAPFRVRVSGLGSFPNPRRARILWVGLHAPAALETLQRGIESSTARLGYASEERPFSPHLTIGRVRQQVPAGDQQRIRAALETSTLGELGTAEITSVHLFKSDLQPGGAVYNRLFSAPLKPQ